MKRKIDIMSIIGLILAFGMVVFGIICNKNLETESYEFTFATMEHFIDPPSILIVIGGVFACLMFIFPPTQFAKIPKHFLLYRNFPTYNGI